MSAFKDQIDAELVRELADRLALGSSFVTKACNDLDDLELKARVIQVADALHGHLGEDWMQRLVEAFSEDTALVELQGWPILRVIEDRGHATPRASMEAIRRLTSTFSGEFAVRPYLIADPEGMLAIMQCWTSSSSEHVRRLASEGCRPRLPWGQRLPAFIVDPEPLFPMLEALVDDESAYVRRSVANNLNDIAKDHPERLVEVVGEWMAPSRERLIRHALRSLVKAGHPGAMSVLGVGAPEVEVRRFEVDGACRVGGSVEMRVELDVHGAQKLIVDYALHFVGKKRRRRKVFKWKMGVFDGNVVLVRNQAMRNVSVRTLYPGEHEVELLVNGRSFGRRAFELI